MIHVEKALVAFKNEYPHPLPSDFDFIKIENMEDVPGVAPVVSFTIQSDPVSVVGLNGVQANDMLLYCKHLFKSLNEAFPCRENALTITKIEEALHWQHARTQDRIRRSVEGLNKA